MLPRRLVKIICTCLPLLLCCGALIPRPCLAQDNAANQKSKEETTRLARALATALTDGERQLLLESAEAPALTVALRKELILLGNGFRAAGELVEALKAYHGAQAVAERINDRQGTAIALYETGRILAQQGDKAAALELYRQSETYDATIVTPSVMASTLFQDGAGYFELGDYSLALEFYRESLNVYEKNNGTKSELVGVLYGIGAIYYLKGDYETALEYHRRCLRLAEDSGKREDLMLPYFGLAADYRMTGDYASALEFYGKSLAIVEERSDKRTAFDPERQMSTILRHIGTTYFSQGNYRLALDYYERSLQHDRARKEVFAIANSLMYIGAVYSAQGRYPQALAYLTEALRSFETLGNKREIAHTLNLIGSVSQQQGDLSRAEEHFRRALDLYEKIQANEGIASALINLANVRAALGDNVQSLTYAVRAADLSRRIGSPDTLWSALVTTGRGERTRGDKIAARRAFDESIQVIESMRTHVAGGEEDREIFFADKVSPYYEMIDMLVGAGQADEAFAYAERAKARVLLDVLRNNHRAASRHLVVAGQARPLPVKRQDENLEARMEKARIGDAAFQTSPSAAHPELRMSGGEAQPIASREMSELVPDDQTALIEYAVTKERVFLFVFTKRDEPRPSPLARAAAEQAASVAQVRLQIYTINLPRAELAVRVERFRRQLAQRDLLFGKDARALYDLLLRPAQEQLRDKTRLIIVPDEKLWELPFQALQPAEGNYVIEQCSVSYAPSATVLREMMRAERPRSPRNAPPTLLAFGNPTLGTQTIARARAVLMQGEAGSAPPALPEAERQVEALAKLYGSRYSRIYTGAAATEERIKRDAPSYRILHLATHGTLDDVNPMYSHVMLAQGGRADRQANDGSPASREDGLLEAWELMGMRLNADMVVLSACETARGEVKAGEGVIGLSWALFVAGSPTTVVSQWKVESASTTELMLNFHRNIHQGYLANTRPSSAGLSKAEALRQASLQLLHSETYAHPFYWASFVLIGDGR